MKAFRWSSDRIQGEGGIIAFITGSGFIDKGSYSGFRKCLEKEFSTIYVYNLKGAIRGKSRREAKKEGQNIFNIMTGVSITILIKSPNKNKNGCEIFYKEIDDYLSRDEKLDLLRNKKSLDNFVFTLIKPNKNADWINQRSNLFETLAPIAPEKKNKKRPKTLFSINAVGVSSAREHWVYDFSLLQLEKRMKSFYEFYNSQRESFKRTDKLDLAKDKISWSVNLKKYAKNDINLAFNKENIRIGLRRPFCKSYLYFDDYIIERPSVTTQMFPTHEVKNLAITIAGKGNRKSFVALITDVVPDYNIYDGGSKYFTLNHYEETEVNNPSLFDESTNPEHIKKSGITDFALEKVRKQYSANNIGKEDIFYYVYGILHSPDYRERFANDLKKMLPRIPFLDDVRDFWSFSKAGRKLADLHINYEQVPPYLGVEVEGDEHGLFKVQKMKFAKKKEEMDGKMKSVNDTSKIIYSSAITISNIPDKAYEYVVNGKSAIEWIMDRYRVKTDKKSGIKNDPNDWAEEVGNPRYILDLLLSVINVSVQTVDIVNNLPKLEFDD